MIARYDSLTLLYFVEVGLGTPNAKLARMESPDSFLSYLRQEVNSAGEQFEQARARVFALCGSDACHPDPRLLETTEDLAETMRMYLAALRRLACYLAHQNREPDRKAAATHA